MVVGSCLCPHLSPTLCLATELFMPYWRTYTNEACISSNCSVGTGCGEWTEERSFVQQSNHLLCLFRRAMKSLALFHVGFFYKALWSVDALVYLAFDNLLLLSEVYKYKRHTFKVFFCSYFSFQIDNIGNAAVTFLGIHFYCCCF